MECHTPMGPRGREFATSSVPAALSSPARRQVGVAEHHFDQDQGHRQWFDADIKRTFTTGVGKDGSKLKPPMGFHYYATMTAGDLDAVVAYLRTVPAKE